MTNEEIRKLLGGYATNSLTEAERKALFEAALEDQELFDALQQEEALRDLLADPISRRQVQEALEGAPSELRAVAAAAAVSPNYAQAPVEPKRASGWWSRRWAWTGAASAVAAAVLIVAVVRSNRPVEKLKSVQVASEAAPSAAATSPVTPPPKTSEPKPTPAPPRRKQAAPADRQPGARNEVKDEVAAATPPPPPAPAAAQPAARSEPPPAAPQQQTGPAPRVQQNQADAQVQAQAAISRYREQERLESARPPAIGGAAFGFRPAAFQYSVEKRDASGSFSVVAPDSLQSGDFIRLAVSTPTRGYLTLWRFDPAGEWKRLSPEKGAGVPVVANGRYLIPDNPIEVKDTEDRLRLTLAPSMAEVSTLEMLDMPGSQKKAAAKAAAAGAMRKQAPASGVATLDITISGKK